jgi:exopolysaccharide biosynthesis polyprenyl glycosylphosphotransferase
MATTSTPPDVVMGIAETQTATSLTARTLHSSHHSEEATWRTARRTAVAAVALLLGDVLAALGGFYVAWFARYQLELGGDVEPFNYVEFEAYLPVGLALATLLVGVLFVRSMYRVPRHRSLPDEYGGVLLSTALATMTLYGATTFLRYPAESRAAFVYAWLFVSVGVMASRTLLRAIQGWLHRRGIGVEQVLVVGDNNLGRMIMQGLTAMPHLGYRVAGFVGDSTAADFGRFRWLGTPEEIDRVIHSHGVDQVFIALPSESHAAILRIVDHCRHNNVRFRLVPDLYQMRLSQVDVEHVYGIPLIGMRELSIRGWNLIMKRMLDMTLSALSLVVTSVPMLIIAMLIKLDPPGPVLFRQVRVGKGGKHFVMYKFRSMHVGAEDQENDLIVHTITGGPTIKLTNDPRRTRVGTLLRRSSLDELPQLWNVLRGEMSMVGPRPPTPREVEGYEEWHHQRLEVSPGLTGIWQVSGRSTLTFDEQVVLDVYYIENWSLGLDLGILLRTIPAVISGGGAF